MREKLRKKMCIRDRLYSEQTKNPEITITQMSFEDGDERLDFGPGVLYAGKGVGCNE